MPAFTTPVPVPGRRFRRLALAAIATSALIAAQISSAAAQSIGFIRDAEIEGLLADYSGPIIRAAGVGQSAVNIYLVSSQSFNAFVADGRRIFINAGVLMQADTPGEVIGVIAHETGHIAGGHLARLQLELSNASVLAAIATALGAGAMAAGASTGSVGGGQAGQAVMMGGNQVAQRVLLRYQRSEEAAADQAALRYLEATSQSAKGMLRTFQRLSDQSVSLRYADPYAVSHPMPRERVAALENIARRSPHFDKEAPAGLQQRHDLARAKLFGYITHPSSVERRYPRSDNSVPAAYARAIADMRSGNLSRAIQGADALIRAAPDYPYFWETKGDMLLQAGRPAEAIEPLRRALSLAPAAQLIRIQLGRALVATAQPGRLDEAIALLREGTREEPHYAEGFRQLALAYGRKGDIPHADLATAQAHAASGNAELAKRFAQRARQGLPSGSPGWLRAGDILTMKER
ncbi:M48 family metalloprotease [Lutibaculum baratangense]|nr:M48 family metalloprotease [Lutibaculum baratangense]